MDRNYLAHTPATRQTQSPQPPDIYSAVLTWLKLLLHQILWRLFPILQIDPA